jgi:hypothetical protein
MPVPSGLGAPRSEIFSFFSLNLAIKNWSRSF